MEIARFIGERRDDGTCMESLLPTVLVDQIRRFARSVGPFDETEDLPCLRFQAILRHESISRMMGILRSTHVDRHIEMMGFGAILSDHRSELLLSPSDIHECLFEFFASRWIFFDHDGHQ